MGDSTPDLCREGWAEPPPSSNSTPSQFWSFFTTTSGSPSFLCHSQDSEESLELGLGSSQRPWGHFRRSLEEFCAVLPRWQLRVCSQVPTKAEIFIYSFPWKPENGKQNGEAAPRKRQELLPGTGTSKAPVSEQQERRDQSRCCSGSWILGFQDFRWIISTPVLPHCSTLVCFTSFL